MTTDSDAHAIRGDRLYRRERHVRCNRADAGTAFGKPFVGLEVIFITEGPILSFIPVAREPVGTVGAAVDW